MSKVICGEIYLGIEDQPDGDVWGINQVGLKNRIWSKPCWKIHAMANIYLRFKAPCESW